MGNLIKFVGVVLFICALLLLGPWVFIWAINTLVQAGGVATFSIPFTFLTWLAAACIGGFAILPSSRRS